MTDQPPAADRELAQLRRELAGLRAENARLARLLDLRGQDVTPAAEQLAMPIAPGSVTMASPVEDKVGLYADRFCARTDAYALFWENTRAGTSGWKPAVAGGWRKGLDRRLVRDLPLTREVITAHLAGEVFIGVYPLLRDNTCRFLAADFDGPAAMLDALAYAKAARADGVPAAVEVSKSGRGAHAWVFFIAPVEASTARAMGIVLLREAMLLRGSMDLRSYDRLFPNQDVLPDAGYGNLIAAPLQRTRRDQGLTVFLDLATLEPHADQWAFLSTLDRLSPGEAARLARRATQAVVGASVTTLARSEATRIQPRLPAILRADLGVRLTLDLTQLTPAAVATFKHAASIANPKFYELQRLRKSTWDTPRFICGYELTLDNQLSLPRGLRHTIADLVERSGSQLTLADSRNPGREIDVTFRGELRGRQEAAVGAMLAHDDGLLVAPPGSGKTVMACAIIAERATATLILVDRKALADQWRSRIEDFLGLRPGQHGGGRKKLTGVVDIAMLPSLARRTDVADLTAGYGQIVVDECHHVAAGAYERTVSTIGAQFWLGLTATPARRDGLDDLVTWQLGPARHTLDQPVDSTLIELADGPLAPNRILHVHETAFAWTDPDPASPNAIALANQALIGDEQRNGQIIADVEHALERGRNCLILTRRVAHLELLAARLTARGHAPTVMQGGMSAAARRAAVQRLDDEGRPGGGLLVIGTTPFIGEGFDAAALDALFLVAPISYHGLLIQCVGRILRPVPGKDLAEVHDYHDSAVPLLAASLPRRMPGYRALGFTRER